MGRAVGKEPDVRRLHAQGSRRLRVRGQRGGLGKHRLWASYSGRIGKPGRDFKQEKLPGKQ